METLAIFPALLFGLMAAMQGPTNASMSRIVGSAQGALISFTGGLLLMCVIVPLFGTGDLSLLPQQPWYYLIAGVYAAACVFGTILVIADLGVALAATLNMLGQLAMGLVVDSFGLLGATPTPLSVWRIAGFALMLVGIGCVYISRRNAEGHAGRIHLVKAAQSYGVQSVLNDRAQKKRRMRFIRSLVIGFGIGVVAAIQVPCITGMSLSIGRLEAGLMNFLGGALCMLVISLVLQKGRLKSPKGAKPWQYLGGAYGVVGITCTIIGTTYLGVSMMLACGMLGQLASSMLIDAKGWLRVKKMRMDRWRWIGLVVMTLGIVCTALGRMM